MFLSQHYAKDVKRTSKKNANTKQAHLFHWKKHRLFPSTQEGISNSSTEINGTALEGHRDCGFKPNGHNATPVIKSKTNGFILKLSHLRSYLERTLLGWCYSTEQQDTPLNGKWSPVLSSQSSRYPVSEEGGLQHGGCLLTVMEKTLLNNAIC